jgi:pyruvate,water dikinase
MDKHKSLDGIVRALQERAKELNCLYKIVELINQPKITLEEIFYGVIEAIPEGWQFPDYCHSRIIYDNREYEGEEFYVTPWMQSTPITLEEEILGYIEVYYTEEMPEEDEGPFLKEERKLIDTISDRLGHFILHNKLKTVFNEWKAKTSSNGKYKPEWLVVLDLLRRTDQPLFSIISRKMINHLFTKGYEGSKVLFEKLGTMSEEEATMTEVNRPTKRQVLDRSFTLADDAFQLASKYLDDVVILSMIQRWINEEKSHFLVRALSNPNTTLSEIADAVRRYYHINPTSDERSSPVSKGIRVSLIRRFLTDQLEFINIAKTIVMYRISIGF